jgi:hypothetical protein
MKYTMLVSSSGGEMKTKRIYLAISGLLLQFYPGFLQGSQANDTATRERQDILMDT